MADIVEQLRERAKRYERNGELVPHCRDARLDERAAAMIESLRLERERLRISQQSMLKALAAATDQLVREARRG